MVAQFEPTVLDFRPPAAPVSSANIEIEEAILGTILQFPNVLEAEVVCSLPVVAFSTRSHRLVFAKMLELHKAGRKPDTLTVQRALEQVGTLQEIGGKTKIRQLLERQAVEPGQVIQYAEVLAEQHQRQQVAESLEKAANKARELDLNAALELTKGQVERLEQLKGDDATLGASTTLRDRISEVLSEVKSASELKTKLLELAQSSGYQTRDVEQIAHELEQEQDREADLLDATTELPQHLNAHQRDIDPHQYLWGDRGTLANAMVKTALAMPTAVAPIFSTLLPATASCIDASSRVIASVTGKYTQPCIFWSMVVAPTGALKTPTQRVVTDVLVELELEAAEKYKIDLQGWEEEMKNLSEGEPTPPKPTRKRYLTQDATIEALECILGENPNLLGYRDEIAGDFKAANAYRGGRGADEQIMLALWNGSAVIADRRSRQVTLGKSAFSRTGAIQFEVLQEICGNHNDVAGTLARFLVCAVDSPPRYYKAGQTIDYGLDGLLKSLFLGLNQLPAKDYFLTPQAEKLFERWQNNLVDAERLEKHSGIRAAYPKIEAYALRLALWLHLVNSVLAGEEPGQQINGYVMKKAIELANFYLGQIRLIYAVNSSQSGIGGRLLNLWLFAKKKLQGITPRDIKRNVGTYRSGRTPTKEIRQDCLSLVEQGYLRCEGDTFYPLEAQCHNVTADVTTPVTSPNPLIEGIPDCNVTMSQNGTTSDFEVVPSQPLPAAAPEQEPVVVVDNEPLVNPWVEPPPIQEEVVTFVPFVPFKPETPSGTGFGDVTSDVPLTVPFGSDVPSESDVTESANTTAPSLPAPCELAGRLFSRGTWGAVLEELDAIASTVNKSRSAVFNKLKKYISNELRRHLIQLLAEEMRWSRHNSRSWDWLDGCAKKMLGEAAELAAT